jgi:diadenylate cyclase
MEILSSFIANLVLSIAQIASDFWLNLRYANLNWWQAIVDVAIVAVVIYYLFSMLKGSRSVSILLGFVMISIIFLLSKALNLMTVGWILDRFFTILLVAIPIIFQQELRMALERLGNSPFSNLEKNLEFEVMINEIVEAVDALVKRKEGALIVIKHSIPLKEYLETGVKIEADLSRELLLSIFNTKGPLHDGAVIIENNRILAAACILPTSFDNKDKNLGTRHKAAIGLTDHTDATVIVVSEEKGTIGFAKNGNLEKGIDLERLKQLLKIVLKVEKPTRKKAKKLKYREE